MSSLVVEDGCLDIKSVENLSYDELRQWIYDRLHGRDDLVPRDVRQDEPPYYLFTRIYLQLERHVRQNVERIVAGFIGNMAYNATPDWQSEAADELLMLAQTIKDDTIIDALVEMAESHCFLNDEDSALHYRLLQTLVALNWRGSVRFWRQEVEQAPERCTGVAIGGLALIGLEHAIDLLPKLPWTPKVENQVLIALGALIAGYGEDAVIPKLFACLPHMTCEARTSISEFLNEEGIKLPSSYSNRAAKATQYFADRQQLQSKTLALGSR